VVGPNGAGKSTLAATIMGLSGYRPQRGDVLFRGESIADLTVDERARLGITLAWQEPARYEGLGMPAFIQAGARDRSPERARVVLEQVGLDPDRYLHRAVDRTLSGGERKRVELASILAMEPRLVIMDEPDSGIDVAALNRIFEALRHLREAGATVLLITHSEAVLAQAEHGFLICCGKLIDKGGIDKIASYFGERCIPCDHKNQPTLGEAVG
jgi:Fe-S cluster assembly ATP-binding protein